MTACLAPLRVLRQDGLTSRKSTSLPATLIGGIRGARSTVTVLFLFAPCTAQPWKWAVLGLVTADSPVASR
ncbi:hypothetical protein GQ53DRAFT_752484 [Thozetella sp. PMI_491]|nr:hypothetical protein GQ53DRAFT_752484 [Thozetella sp. PMI_491]